MYRSAERDEGWPDRCAARTTHAAKSSRPSVPALKLREGKVVNFPETDYIDGQNLNEFQFLSHHLIL